MKKRGRVILWCLFFSIALLVLHPFRVSGSSVVVRTEDALIAAMSDRSIHYIVIDGDIALSVAVNVFRPVTLHGQGTISVLGNHRHFVINSGQFTLDGDILLTRAAYNTGYGGGIEVAGGHFILRAGVICNNHMPEGGGVLLNRGNMTMHGGSIQNNHAKNGGGIFIHDTERQFPNRYFVMRSGSIENNTALFAGGGIFAATSTVQLFRGAIIYNEASGHGGLYACTSTILTIGHRMRIAGNTPVNSLDAPAISLLNFLRTASWFHVVFMLVIIAVCIGMQNRKSNRRANNASKPPSKIEVAREVNV